MIIKSGISTFISKEKLQVEYFRSESGQIRLVFSGSDPGRLYADPDLDPGRLYADPDLDPDGLYADRQP